MYRQCPAHLLRAIVGSDAKSRRYMHNAFADYLPMKLESHVSGIHARPLPETERYRVIQHRMQARLRGGSLVHKWWGLNAKVLRIRCIPCHHRILFSQKLASLITQGEASPDDALPRNWHDLEAYSTLSFTCSRPCNYEVST